MAYIPQFIRGDATPLGEALVTQTTTPEDAREILGISPAMDVMHVDVDADNDYAYYGGTVSGEWKINRYDVRDDHLTMTSATQTGNPSIVTLVAAWESRDTLAYS